MDVLPSRATVRVSYLAVIAVVVLLPVFGCASTGSTGASATDTKPEAGADPIAKKVGDAEKREGLLTFYVDREGGKIWLELPAVMGAGEGESADEGKIGEFLYVEGLLTGLGSNPVGLDRGQLGDSKLVVFRRLGDRLLIEEPNLGFRALSDNRREQLATRQSFASSVLWAGKIEERAPNGRSLVDFTSFLVRDAHGVAATLKRTGQGNYRLDRDRSAIDFSACLAFPDNLEFEALLTYTSDAPGRLVSRTAPMGEAFGLVQHHSLIRLPDDGYTPREFDPRAGSFAISFQDYAAPLGDTIHKRWIVRHRLTESGPDSEIVYYVDPGAPEPVRSALIDGAEWWGEAFEAAGFPNAYRVEVLPEGAHPLDVRYNVIQWVHRSTRGWSYGGGVVDPRTGEMIKGHVSLGSLRVRQDRLIFEGLLGTEKTGSGAPDDPVELALARIRQLSAHEVGHTLGFAHNFAASTYGRASVMDYPAPKVSVTETGEIDVSDAYGVGIGAWDVYSARYAYTDFGAGDERAELDAIVREGIDDGLAFISDADARPPGAAQPVGSLWDNGADAAAELATELEVRRIAIQNFGEHNIPEGTPLALLEETFAPVYFRHRYQLEAAVKMVGGLDYGYPVRGDGQGGVTAIPAADQRRALGIILSAVEAPALDVPESVLALLAPRPFGYRGNRELFHHRTSPAFDSLGAAATAADLVASGLLQHERAARLVDQHRRNPGLPGLEEVIDALVAAAFSDSEAESRHAEIGRETQNVVVHRLIDLAGHPRASPAVAARAEAALNDLAGDLEDSDAVADAMMAAEIERFLSRPAPAATAGTVAPQIPPGSPIGASGPHGLSHGSAGSLGANDFCATDVERWTIGGTR